MNNHFHTIVLIALASFLSIASQASRNYRFYQLGIEEGLSQVTITDIYQDELGRMWFGTRDGLNMYDGNHIKVYKPIPNDSTSLSYSFIRKITGDGMGNLFIQTISNILLFDLQKETFSVLFPHRVNSSCKGKNGLWFFLNNILYFYDNQTKELNTFHSFSPVLTYVQCLYESTDGRCWIGANSGLYAIDSNRVVSTHLSGALIRHIYEDKNKNLWVGSSDKGLFMYAENGTWTNYRHHENDSKSLINNHIRAICEDNLGNIWLGSPFGLCCFDRQKNEFNTLLLSSENQLNSQSVNCLFKDKYGVVWVGTYFGGVKYLNPESSPLRLYHPKEDGLPYSIIGKFAEDKNGIIWICTEGGGIASFDPQTDRFESFKLPGNNFKSIVYDAKKHCLWLGTHISILVRFDIATEKATVYNSQDKPSAQNFGSTLLGMALYENKLLIGATQGLRPFDPETGTIVPFIEEDISHPIFAIFIDSRQKLWIGTNGYGLICYDLEQQTIKRFRHEKSDLTSISGDIINVVFEDSKGRIWIGTNGFGLNLYHPETNNFSLYTKENNALLDNNITAIAETHSGTLLIGTGIGLSGFSHEDNENNENNDDNDDNDDNENNDDNDDNQITNYQYQNGFPLVTLNENSLFVSSSGSIYVGGVSGMAILKEENLKFVPTPGEIRFTKLFVNNQEVKPGDPTGIISKTLPYTNKITINPNYSVFSVEFAIDNYLHSHSDGMEYRLAGYNSEWMHVQSENVLTYTNLSPGSYTLELRLKHFPESIRSLAIVVPPPFYRTKMAYLLYILTFVLLIYLFIRQAKTRFYLKTSLEFEKKEKEKNEELIQSKLRFFTNISHEIKTPITLIMGQADHLLQSHRIHPGIYNKIVNIHKSASSLNGLINELLDFRKQEQGHLKLKISQVNFIDFLKETFIVFSDYAVNKKITFDFRHNVKNLPLWIDTEQMQKVVNNLLSNAFKYTPEGGRIIIAAEEKENEVIFSVSDTGIGIEADKIDLIFDRFYQIAQNMHVQGTGIGLALSKGIVLAHDGTIQVKSEEGCGSTFIVTLKKGDAHFKDDIVRLKEKDELKAYIKNDADIDFMEEVKKTQEEVGSRQASLLIVEDNEEVRELLREVFSPIYKTEIAVDGRDGLEKVRSFQPDIVISDIMMPNMSGIELCEKIKNNLETCHIPIILLTARMAAEHKFQVWRIGADDYIAKPFDIKLLILRCNNLINSRKLIQKKYVHQTELSPQTLATTAIDTEFIQKATAIVEENLTNVDFNIDVFAQTLGLGRTTLFNKLRGITGLTPNTFILNIKLKKAAHLLIHHPEMNASEIAYAIGFNSPGYFNKCFKSLFDYTPVEFRNKNKHPS